MFNLIIYNCQYIVNNFCACNNNYCWYNVSIYRIYYITGWKIKCYKTIIISLPSIKTAAEISLFYHKKSVNYDSLWCLGYLANPNAHISQAHASAWALKLTCCILKSPNLQTQSLVQCSDYVIFTLFHISSSFHKTPQI